MKLKHFLLQTIEIKWSNQTLHVAKTSRRRDIKSNLYVGKVNLYWYTPVRHRSIWFSQIEYIWYKSSIVELYSEVFNDSISH